LQLGPFPPPHGGVEINLVAIRDYLRRRQIQCGVINLTRHRRPNADEVVYPKSAVEVISSLLRSDARVLHLHIGGDVSWRLLFLGFICSLLPGSKANLTLKSGGYPSSAAGKAARRFSFRGFLLRWFDGLIGVNQEIANMFVRFGVPENKIRVIVPFALRITPRTAELPEQVRIFCGSRKPMFVSVNGLEPEYDIPLQIGAFEDALRKFPNAGLLICGGGSLQATLRAEIATKPFADHILLAGDLPHDVVLNAISQADAFMRTTQYDGDSIAVREALHLGVPAIATDTGARPGGVHLIPIGDRAALAEALSACGTGAVKPAESRLETSQTDEGNLASVLDFYAELLGCRVSDEIAVGQQPHPCNAEPNDSIG